MHRTPQDLQHYLEQAGIQAQLIDEIGDTPTVPAAAAALGVAPDQIVKTLLFLVEQPGVDGGAAAGRGHQQRRKPRTNARWPTTSTWARSASSWPRRRWCWSCWAIPRAGAAFRPPHGPAGDPGRVGRRHRRRA
ncbi:MAG: hypothetical protein R2854_15680 [Caldilineaceae bacterium]